MNDALFSPVRLGGLTLRNRVVMAPMTRSRAGPGDVPSDIMVEYYRQRAGAGLIITEGTQPSPAGKGYWRTPGIHSQAQIDGWRRVGDAVHAAGGLIVMQLMHCGRVVVPQNRDFSADIIAPSALPCPAKVPGPNGVPVAAANPRELAAHELPPLAREFGQAAANAVAAGLDGVELHCASGYLINQFLNPASNRRSDGSGGDAQARLRFPMMVLESLAEAIGPERVGFRISPGNGYNGMETKAPWDTFAPFLEAANELGFAYVHVVDMGKHCPNTLARVRERFAGPIIANNMLDGQAGAALIEAGSAQAVSFGRHFIANPDLPERLRTGAILTAPTSDNFYQGEHQGYIDYPALEPGSGVHEGQIVRPADGGPAAGD